MYAERAAEYRAYARTMRAAVLRSLKRSATDTDERAAEMEMLGAVAALELSEADEDSSRGTAS